MNIRATLLVLISSIGVVIDSDGQDNDHVQESRYRPFRVVIVSPDTAIINDSLVPYVDAVEKEFKDTYHEMLREIELRRDSVSHDEKEKIESEIRKVKTFESDVLNFRYYDMVAIATFVSLQEDFKKYPWEDRESLECLIVDNSELQAEGLAMLALRYDSDYVLYFKDIVAEKHTNDFEINMTAGLFSRLDAKVLFEKRVSQEGNDFLCQLYRQNLLQCMMTRVVDEVSRELFEILNDRQKR